MADALSKKGRAELTTKIVVAIADMQAIPAESISLDSKFEELGIDSLTSFDLLCELEEELGVVIPDDDAKDISTVRDVVLCVEPLIAAAA